jgi:hypothetical protein
MEWISANCGFLCAETRKRQDRTERQRWSAAEVVSLLAYRAARGGGIARSLRRHAQGEMIANPRALLLRYMKYAVEEVRAEYRDRDERVGRLTVEGGSLWQEVPCLSAEEGGTTVLAIPSREDLPADAEADTYYGQVIALLAARLGGVGRRSEPPTSVTGLRPQAYLQERERLLWEIFRHYVPARVCELAEGWDDDDLRCVLLGVFPLQLSAGAVARYRGLRGTPGPRPVTPDSTARKVRRLREVIKDAWPADQAPRLGSEGTERGGHPTPENPGGGKGTW